MYHLATVVVIFGALLHGVTLVLGNFAADVLPLAIFLVLYLVLAVFLFKRIRMAAWVAFFVGLVGVAIALRGVGSGSAAPDNVFYATAVINFIIAACMLPTMLKLAGHR